MLNVSILLSFCLTTEKNTLHIAKIGEATFYRRAIIQHNRGRIN